MATLFTKIINGEIPGKVIYQDDQCAALLDIAPKAPTHILIVPKKEIISVSHAKAEDQMLLGHLILTAAKIAKDAGLADGGYRLVINTGPDAGQSVSHIHIHLLGGRELTWPPG